MFAIAVFFLSLIVVATARDLPCSEVKGVDDFNIDTFINGDWYQIARYPDEWENNAECVVLRFSRQGNSYKFNISDVFDNTHKSGSFGGYIELENTGKTGLMDYISPIFKDYAGTNKLTTRIIDVNYDHYCIFYECEYDTDNSIRKDHVWVLSRSKSLEPDAKKQLEDFFAANKNLDINKLIWVKFTKEACT